MPKRLKIVLAMMIIGWVLSFVLLLVGAFDGRPDTPRNGIVTTVALAIHVPIILGLLAGSPWAWTVTRVFTFLGIILNGLVIIVALFVAVRMPVIAMIYGFSHTISLLIDIIVFRMMGKREVRAYFARNRI